MVNVSDILDRSQALEKKCVNALLFCVLSGVGGLHWCSSLSPDPQGLLSHIPHPSSVIDRNILRCGPSGRSVSTSSAGVRTQPNTCRYNKYLEDEKPKQKPVPKGDHYQVEYDECDQAATKLAEVCSPSNVPLSECHSSSGVNTSSQSTLFMVDASLTAMSTHSKDDWAT
jgi:hypothetical protein